MLLRLEGMRKRHTAEEIAQMSNEEYYFRVDIYALAKEQRFRETAPLWVQFVRNCVGCDVAGKRTLDLKMVHVYLEGIDRMVDYLSISDVDTMSEDQIDELQALCEAYEKLEEARQVRVRRTNYLITKTNI